MIRVAKKKEKPFFRPFEGIAKKLQREMKEVAASPPQPSQTPRVPSTQGGSDEIDFAAFMGDVEPVEPDHRGRKPPKKDKAKRGPAMRVDALEDAEVLAHLAGLVGGDEPFDIADSDEFIEGSVRGLDPRICRALRRGDYAISGHVDLHGLTRDEAKVTVVRFLENARRNSWRCVLIVHGRGLHSKEAIPVLKDLVRMWLTRGALARQVLAFSTARPSDGGTGALYVLLRRERPPR